MMEAHLEGLPMPQASMPSSAATAYDTFHKFAELPKELRLQIWEYAVGSRVVPLYRSIDRFKAGIYYPTRRMPVSFMALTMNHASLSVIRAVCLESKRFCQKHFMDSQIWDVRQNHMGTPLSPKSDIIYFSHQINVSLLLDFVGRFPEETRTLRRIALPNLILPGTTSRVEILEILRAFEKLQEVIFVLGKTELAENNPGSRWEGDYAGRKDRWVLPGSVVDALERLKREKAPTWKLPLISVVKFQEDILT